MSVLEKSLSRRSVLAGLSSGMLAGPAFARSPEGDFFSIADHARQLSSQRGSDTLSLLLPQNSSATVRSAMSRFTDLTGVSFSVREAPVTELGTTLLVDLLQGKSAFDVVLLPTHEIPDLVAADAIQPLDQFETSLQPLSARCQTIYREGDSFDNRIYGYQTDGDAYIMFLNDGLLRDPAISAGFADRFGTKLSTPRSWEMFDRQARFVSEEFDLSGGVLHRSIGQIEWEFWLRLHAKGIWPLSEDFEPQLHSEGGVEALEEMIALSKHITPHAHGSNSFWANWRAFSQGNSLATFGWGGTQKFFRQGVNEMSAQLTYSMVPGGNDADTPNQLPFFNWGWSYTVATGSSLAELANTFAVFSTTAGISNDAIRDPQGYFDPFCTEHFEDPEVEQIYGSDFLAVQRSSLEMAIPDFYVARRALYRDILGRWLTLALEGSVSPRNALGNVRETWLSLASGAERDRQARRWTDLRSKYPTSIARRLRDL